MNKIEEIKKKLNEGEYDINMIGGTFSGKGRWVSDDIQYLLSKLEIAEKVLEKISIPMPGSRDNELVKYYEREAGKALQQIRS